jgi:hypothetical protein
MRTRGLALWAHADDQSLKEIRSLIEGDAKCWRHAAGHYRRFAKGRTLAEKAEMNLLSAVFLERAKLHEILLSNLRPRASRAVGRPIGIDSIRTPGRH